MLVNLFMWNMVAAIALETGRVQNNEFRFSGKGGIIVLRYQFSPINYPNWLKAPHFSAEINMIQKSFSYLTLKSVQSCFRNGRLTIQCD